MKKIGILVNSIGYGGNERSAVNIAKAIQTKYDVSIIIQEDCGNHYKYNGNIINLNTPCAASKIGKVINSFRRIVRLKKVIKDKQIDTLLIILPVSNPINYLGLKCRKIVSCRDCGDLMKRTDKYIRMTEKSDLIICNSAYQSNYLTFKKKELKEKTHVIYNIIDIDLIKKLKRQSLDKDILNFMEGHKCIVSTGRFAPPKGLNNLLKAFSIISQKDDNVRLLMIGDGELRGNIEKLIKDLNLQNKVLLPGFQDNPFKYISKSDIFVLPSFYEGFPNTLIEAMACGTPVIAADCPSGPTEILQGSVEDSFKINKYGVLFKSFLEKESTWDANDIDNNHYILAKLFGKILEDDDLSKEMVKNAYLRVNDFTADNIANEWIKIL